LVLKQYYLGCLAHASYLIADEDSGQAAVVDPQRDIEQYLDDAARLGVRIGHVFLTHLHADFVAGHLELRDRAGALIHLGARAKRGVSVRRDGRRRHRRAGSRPPGGAPDAGAFAGIDLDPGARSTRAVADARPVGIFRPDATSPRGPSSPAPLRA
jgi:glyoxylase-like metal-dependent hydrolase (beta-lactamase superfamily II)